MEDSSDTSGTWDTWFRDNPGFAEYRDIWNRKWFSGFRHPKGFRATFAKREERPIKSRSPGTMAFSREIDSALQSFYGYSVKQVTSWPRVFGSWETHLEHILGWLYRDEGYIFPFPMGAGGHDGGINQLVESFLKKANPQRGSRWNSWLNSPFSLDQTKEFLAMLVAAELQTTCSWSSERVQDLFQYMSDPVFAELVLKGSRENINAHALFHFPGDKSRKPSTVETAENSLADKRAHEHLTSKAKPEDSSNWEDLVKEHQVDLSRTDHSGLMSYVRWLSKASSQLGSSPYPKIVMEKSVPRCRHVLLRHLKAAHSDEKVLGLLFPLYSKVFSRWSEADWGRESPFSEKATEEFLRGLIYSRFRVLQDTGSTTDQLIDLAEKLISGYDVSGVLVNETPKAPEETATMSNTQAIAENVFSSVADAFKAGATMAAANQFNQAAKGLVGKAICKATGLPTFMIEDGIPDTILEIASPILLTAAVEMFEDRLPEGGADIILEGCQAAIAATSYTKLRPLLDMIRPHLIKLTAGAQKVVDLSREETPSKVVEEAYAQTC